MYTIFCIFAVIYSSDIVGFNLILLLLSVDNFGLYESLLLELSSFIVPTPIL